MKDDNPFSRESLNEIFKISPIYPDRILSRENHTLEFKESFHSSNLSKYIKTTAAFANSRGGYFVFGVADNPRLLKGLTPESIQSIENFDAKDITEFFNSCLSPEISWDWRLHEVDEKNFLILYISQASEKPVICVKNHGKDIKEGDIFYRYRGRSERIRYPELRSLLDQNRKQEQLSWMRLLKDIAKIGVRDSFIFDIKSGKTSGPGGAFVIDEDLLKHVSFIREGEFSEVSGRPTLKLIGSVETARGTILTGGARKIVKTRSLDVADIVYAALREEEVHEPTDYIKQICSGTSGFLPVFYFMKRASISTEECIEMLNGLKVRTQAKIYLTRRLEEKRTGFTPISASDGTKNEILQKLREEKIEHEIPEDEALVCLQVIRGLHREEIIAHSLYLRNLLVALFDKHYTGTAQLADRLRRAICWIDQALYMPNGF